MQPLERKRPQRLAFATIPSAQSNNLITMTCNMLEGVGDFRHLQAFAAFLHQRYPYYRFGLVLAVAGGNRALLQRVLNQLPQFENQFEHLYIKVKTQVNCEGEDWDEHDEAFKSQVKHAIIDRYESIETMRKIKQQTVLFVNVSTQLFNTHYVYFRGLNQSQQEFLFMQYCYNEIFDKSTPIVSINEHGITVQHERVISANMGVGLDVNNQPLLGIRVQKHWLPAQAETRRAIIEQLNDPRLKQYYQQQHDPGDIRKLAIGYLQSELTVSIFLLTQIRAALAEGCACDIILGKKHFNTAVNQNIIARLATELAVDIDYAVVTPESEENITAQIRIVVGFQYNDEDYESLWRLADLSTGSSGDDTLCHAFSSIALPFIYAKAGPKLEHFYQFLDYAKQLKLARLSAYFEALLFDRPMPRFTLLDVSFNDKRLWDNDTSVHEMQQRAILSWSAKIAEQMNPELLREWQQCREQVLTQFNIFDQLPYVINQGLELARQRGKIKTQVAMTSQEFIRLKTLKESRDKAVATQVGEANGTPSHDRSSANQLPLG